MLVINKYVILMNFGLAFGVDRKYSFSVTDVSYQQYDNVISDVYDIVSLTACSSVCAEDSCCSFLFDETSQRCITYSAFVLSTVAGYEWKYAEINLDICRGPMPYTPPAPNQCDHGWSYDASDNKCVTGCTPYGSTYGTFEGYVLSGFNDATISDSSEQACQDACTAALFDCRTAELSSSLTCYLSVDTALTQPASYSTSTSYTLWQRNCA